jgi:hypothetical protein
LFSNLNDVTLTSLESYGITGGYKLSSDVSISSGKVTTLAEGVSVDMQGYDINVYGALNAEFTETADFLVTTRDYAYLNIRNGGQVNLKNASINIGSGSLWGQVNVNTGALLTMEGGDLFANHYNVSIANGGEARLNGTHVRSAITNAGTLTLTGVTSTSNIASSGTLTATDTSTSSYLKVTSSGVLDGVSCTTLHVDSDSDVSVGEGGLTLTGTEAMRLTNAFTGNKRTASALMRYPGGYCHHITAQKQRKIVLITVFRKLFLNFGK